MVVWGRKPMSKISFIKGFEYFLGVNLLQNIPSLCVLWHNFLFTVNYYHAPVTHFVNFAAGNVDLTKRCQKKVFRPGSHVHRQWWLYNDCCLANTNCKILSIVRHIALLKMLKIWKEWTSKNHGHMILLSDCLKRIDLCCLNSRL